MRLGLGLRRSLICFAPLAFVSQRQKMARKVPSPSVFLMISTHFTAPLQVPVTPPILKQNSFKTQFPVRLEDLSVDLLCRLRNPLRPVNPDNACTLRITAAAGT